MTTTFPPLPQQQQAIMERFNFELNQPEVVKKDMVWECNECGSQEYTMAVSEHDVQNLGCGRCGGDEWHKAEER